MSYKTNLDRTVKAKWVAALRSGKYKQTQGLLYREEGDPDNGNSPPGYCCLGVLARVQGKPNRSLRGYGGLSFRATKQDPRPAWEVWFGKNYGYVTDRLIKMNDSERRSFKEIAAWIVKNL